MAENMQDIKRRMKSIRSTEHITNAMRLVSAAKYKKAKNIFDSTNIQLKDVTDTIEDLLKTSDSLPKEYVKRDEVKHTTIVVIGSSKGLCGGFNTNLIKKTSEYMDALDGGISIYAIGSRAKDFFERRGVEIIGEYLSNPEEITFEEARKISNLLIGNFVSGATDQIVVIYTAYISSLKQEPIVKLMLPLEENNEEDLEKKELEFKPSFEEVIQYMIPKYFEIGLFKAIIESATCEHAARRNAMENATDNAREILSSLSLEYNRVRQAEITGELIEVVSGSQSQM